MELGDGGIRWFRYVPVWNGNRDLPPDEQLSVEIRRPRTIEVLAQGDTPGELEEWKQERLRKWLDDEEYGPDLKKIPTEILVVMRQFVKNTRAFTNFVFDGKPVTDAVEVFLRTSLNVKDLKRSLCLEIANAIGDAATLSGDALKNYVAQCAGSRRETTQTQNSASSAASAPTASSPCAGAASPDVAPTLPATTAPLPSENSTTAGAPAAPEQN